jgi:DNA-binding beta-propeller fold protein YncE
VADRNNGKIRQIVIATGVVTTLAGSYNCNWWDAASFCYPSGITTDGTNLYVSDTNNHSIRKIVIATAVVTTFATGIYYPQGITTDGTNLYVADMYNSKIRQIVIATGVTTTLAGSGGWGNTDATGTAAMFSYPRDITTDGTNLYVADMYNHSIRKIVIATAVVTTLATGISYPQGITTDGTNLYVAQPNYPRILQIAISSGAVSTLAGGNYGATDGAGTAATFDSPYGITTDGTNLYVADSYNNKIRKIVIATGVVSSFTGTANTQMASGAADGAGSSASFNYPQGITLSGGNLYVADSGNNTIRQISIATQTVSTLAGAALGADGTGAAARFNYPGHTTTDGTNLYVADSSDYTIRKIVIATGAVTTLAGKAGEWGFVDGTGADARFGYPVGITTDGTNLYVTDTDNYTIRKIVIATGAVTSLAGSGSRGSRDGTGAQALFESPVDITTDGTNLYVTDDSNNNIRKIVIATRVVTTLAGSVNSRGSADGTGTAALFSSPSGITTDGTNLYVVDSNNNKIRKIVIATGVVTSFTGVADTQMGSAAVDGAAVDATFSYPQGITTDGTNLYVADSNNNKIRKIVIATGEVSSVTGAANAYVSAGRTDGAAVDASFDYPYGITTDGTSLYVSDDNNSTIRKIQ